MLHQLTWQQFLIAALILTLIWYGALALLFYRRQIREVWRGKEKVARPFAPVSKASMTEPEDEPGLEAEELMGKPAMPEGMSRVSMNLFGFAPLMEEEGLADGKQRQRGLIPDVMQELKNIFHVLELERGTKADFIALFGLVSGKYPQIRGTPDEALLNEYIRDHVLFPISDGELEELWV